MSRQNVCILFTGCKRHSGAAHNFKHSHLNRLKQQYGCLTPFVSHLFLRLENHPPHRMPPVLGTPDGKHGAKHAGQTHPWHHRKNPLNSKKNIGPSGVSLRGQAETFAQPHKTTNFVIPAQAGIQYYQALPGFRFSPE